MVRSDGTKQTFADNRCWVALRWSSEEPYVRILAISQSIPTELCFRTKRYVVQTPVVAKSSRGTTRMSDQNQQTAAARCWNRHQCCHLSKYTHVDTCCLRVLKRPTLSQAFHLAPTVVLTPRCVVNWFWNALYVNWSSVHLFWRREDEISWER
jgi:hypothetical protein